MEIHNDRKVSIALPHFNRFVLLCKAVEMVAQDERVDEIVISDDCSTDGSWAMLNTWVKDHPKVKLFRNKQNQDCYRNKRLAVERASNDWVILFDDDNVMDVRYLDALFRLAWDPQTIYCPDYAQPHFDYRAFSGTTVSKGNVAGLMNQKHFATLLNTANYLVPRMGYLTAFDHGVDPHTADSIYMAYRWLLNGGELFVVPGLTYFHRVHDGSHYKNNQHKTGDFARTVEANLRKLK